MCFIAQFDALYARNWFTEQLLTLKAQLAPRSLTVTLTTLVHTRIADGSLRPDLDPGRTIHSVLNAASATQRRRALFGTRLEQEYGQPISDGFTMYGAASCVDHLMKFDNQHR